MPLSGMPWIFLSAAILFEVASTTSMKLSRGFAEMRPSVGMFCSAVAMILALRRLELSIAYAIWSGVRYGPDRDDRYCFELLVEVLRTVGSGAG